jgi:protein-tyrosine phosphatase
MKKRIRVMFVCTGNICRSPMAEAVFSHIVQEAGLQDHFEVASSGTDAWHVGERPHHGTQSILKKRAVALEPTKKAQQLIRSHFDEYDYVIAMDSLNVADMARFQSDVPLLLSFAPTDTPSDVPDPYYVGGFDYVYDLVLAGCRGLLAHICEREKL